MTTFNQTITNSLALLGSEPTNVWGTMTWGQNWAIGDIDLVTTTIKVIGESLTLDSSVSASPIKVISNSILFSGDMSLENVVDTAGWYTVFGSSTNAESRPLTSFTSITTGSGTYTSIANAGTTWS